MWPYSTTALFSIFSSSSLSSSLSSTSSPLSTLLLILLLHTQGLFCQQTFNQQPLYTEVNPGSNTSLSCDVNNIGGECRWQKDGKPFGLFASKYEWSGDPLTGDCGLNVFNVNLQFDDGVWECQVTASSLQSQDALVSSPARLVVRVPPEEISVRYQDQAHSVGDAITIVEDKEEEVVCVTRYSNPAPTIQWFLGEERLHNVSQTNSSEADSPRKWRADSVLSHRFTKEDLGLRLRCVVLHEAYATSVGETYVTLDVLYKPTVSISIVSSGVLEEGVGSISLTCASSANPPARVMWTKYGSVKGPQYVESLELNPVTRQDTGTYICQAENSIGLSQEESTEVDVLYSPKITGVTPSGGTLVSVHNKTVLTCLAEGNPTPKYQWLQQISSKQVRRRGYTSDLMIDDVMYEHQGEYVCEAVNVIGGERRVVQSEPVKIEVSGAPQVVRGGGDVTAVSGRDVRLEAEFCSDPLPQKNTWEWGSVVLPAGAGLQGRYQAEEMVEHPDHEDCYISRLTVRGVGPEDSRKYFLNVENKHGTDRFPVALSVQDPVSMASVIVVVMILLVLFVVMVVMLLYSYKTEKLCFKETNNAKSDKNSTKVNGHEEVAVIGSNPDNLHPDMSFYRTEDDKVFRGDDKLYRGDDKVYRGEDKVWRKPGEDSWDEAQRLPPSTKV